MKNGLNIVPVGIPDKRTIIFFMIVRTRVIRLALGHPEIRFGRNTKAEHDFAIGITITPV
jgi:hypothetical protein